MTLNFKKSLGQNFLIDNKIINLITEIGNIEHIEIINIAPKPIIKYTKSTIGNSEN